MSEMSDERLKLLVCKYLADRLTEEESNELNTYGTEYPQVWLLIARLQDEDQLTADLGEIQDMDVRGSLEDALSIIDEANAGPFYKRPFWRVAAIILPILALVGGGLWIGLRRHQDKIADNKNIVHAVRSLPPDIHGGGNKAILTLAGGQRLNLQDQPTGDIAFQNGARLVKADSSLSYVPVPLPYVENQENSITPQYNTLTTPRSGQFSVTLPDGSKVWLNDSSRLSYPTFFSGAYREVALTGEAYFEVAKNPAHPFHVKVNDLTVIVLGTNFTIRAYGDEGNTTTTLLKGKIVVQDGRREQLLAPNEQVSIDGQKNWQFRKGVDPESVLAWKNGIFYFTHADIPTVMHALAGWYGIEVEIRVPPNQYYYDGEFSMDVSLSVILNYLTNEDVHFSREGNKVIVTP
jgi:transmembrane sensor